MPTSGGRQQQQDDQGKAGDQDPEDILVRDLAREHRDISIARPRRGPHPLPGLYTMLMNINADTPEFVGRHSVPGLSSFQGAKRSMEL